MALRNLFRQQNPQAPPPLPPPPPSPLRQAIILLIQEVIKTAPPFVSSNFTFSAPIALAPAAGSTTGNIGEPSVDVDPANRNIYVSAPTGVPCGANSTDECVAFWRSTDGGSSFVQPAPAAFQHPIGGGESPVGQYSRDSDGY